MRVGDWDWTWFDSVRSVSSWIALGGWMDGWMDCLLAQNRGFPCWFFFFLEWRIEPTAPACPTISGPIGIA